MWDRSKQVVQGVYMGVAFRGIVRSSRVKYGMEVQHTVDLIDPITVFCVTRDTVLINESDKFVVLEDLACS